MEMERIFQDDFLKHLNPGENSLDRFIETPKKCDNSYVDYDIEQGLNIYVHQDTQGGKTTGMEYMAVTGALDSSLLPIIMSMDRVNAAIDLKASCEGFTDILARVCEIAKIENPPELQVTVLEPGNWQNYVHHAKEWLQNPSELIPVLVLIANPAKLKLLVDEVIPRISKVVTKEEVKKTNKENRALTKGRNARKRKAAEVAHWVENPTPKRDKNGNAPFLLLVDEADQLFKTANRTSATEKTVWKKMDLGDQVKTSLFASVSTVAWVTATQAAVTTNLIPEVDIPALAVPAVVIKPTLSTYNFQYRQRPGHKNRVILRKYVIEVKEEEEEEEEKKYREGTYVVQVPGSENYIPVVDKIIASDNYRALLISCPRFHTGTDRNKAARKLAVLCSTRPDSSNRQVVIFSWSHDQLLIFTASTKIKAAIGALGIDKSPTHQGDLAEYKTRIKNSYRVVLRDLNQQLQKSSPEPVLKIITFANQMAERSVSVKGADHCLPITDMFVDGIPSNFDGLQQKLGRLCGSVKCIAVDRILWATPYVHEQHEQGLDNTDTFVNVIGKGKTIAGAFHALIEEANNAPNDGTLRDSDGLMAASTWKNSRKGAMDILMGMKHGVQKRIKRKKLTLESCVVNVDDSMLDLDFLGADMLEAETAIMASAEEGVAPPGLTEDSVNRVSVGEGVAPSSPTEDSVQREIGPPEVGDLIKAVKFWTEEKFGPMTKEDTVAAFEGDELLPSITLATVEYIANHEDLKKAGIEFCVRGGHLLPMFHQIEEGGGGAAGGSVAREAVCDPEPDIPYLMQYKLSLLIQLMREVLDATYAADSEGVSVGTMAQEIAGKSSYPDTGEETRAPAVVRHIGREQTAALEAAGIAFYMVGPKKIGRFYLK